MGKGVRPRVVAPLSRNHSRSYRIWHSGSTANDFALGAVQFVPAGTNLHVANLIGQHGYRTENGTPPVRYEAIRAGLHTVGTFARSLGTGATVHMPRIGCGLAGGDWKTIAGIIIDTLGAVEVPVVVYDLPQTANDGQAPWTQN